MCSIHMCAQCHVVVPPWRYIQRTLLKRQQLFNSIQRKDTRGSISHLATPQVRELERKETQAQAHENHYKKNKEDGWMDG